MKDRIQQIMDREGMTPARFADSIGIQRSALSHILNARNNPSLDVVMKIMDRFDYLSTDWLLYGKEPMFKHQCLEKVEKHNYLNAENLIIRTDVKEQPENLKDFASNQPENQPKIQTDSHVTSVNSIVVKEVEKVKTISKIMIFYSDNTFENFIPEKMQDK